MGVLVPPAIGVESTLIAVKSTQQVPEDIAQDKGDSAGVGRLHCRCRDCSDCVFDLPKLEGQLRPLESDGNG